MSASLAIAVPATMLNVSKSPVTLKSFPETDSTTNAKMSNVRDFPSPDPVQQNALLSGINQSACNRCTVAGFWHTASPSVSELGGPQILISAPVRRDTNHKLQQLHTSRAWRPLQTLRETSERASQREGEEREGLQGVQWLDQIYNHSG